MCVFFVTVYVTSTSLYITQRKEVRRYLLLILGPVADAFLSIYKKGEGRGCQITDGGGPFLAFSIRVLETAERHTENVGPSLQAVAFQYWWFSCPSADKRKFQWACSNAEGLQQHCPLCGSRWKQGTGFPLNEGREGNLRSEGEVPRLWKIVPVTSVSWWSSCGWHIIKTGHFLPFLLIFCCSPFTMHFIVQVYLLEYACCMTCTHYISHLHWLLVTPWMLYSQLRYKTVESFLICVLCLHIVQRSMKAWHNK